MPAENDAPDSPPRAPWARRAVALEDRFHRMRERRGRRRGLEPVVIPYSGYGGNGWIRVLCRVLLARPDATRRTPETIRGWRSFVSIPVADCPVTITADGQQFVVHADRGGVVDVDLTVHLEPGLRTITLQAEGSQPVTARVFVVDPDARIGIVSDIDDTVMVTALPRPFLAAWNTFVLDEHARRPVPGMAVLLERLTREHEGSPVIYLSTGAWNVAPTLDRFMSRHLYPAGTMLLTDWGPTHDRLFRSGQEHKRESLARLAREFPAIRWVLIGDDGQHDEALYREFAGAHPDNVAAIAIRQLSTPEAVFAGGRSHLDEGRPPSDVPWVWAPDGAGLAEQLADVGLLDDHANGD
ncbi:App1 family protein [Microcella sp.]|uniref:App1 family protein n=1 Tax=Microcella sp. TaxID=1913979 RepID=UPI003F6ECB2C